MPLYHVQDADRPMWIVAPGWGEAVTVWKRVIEKENGPTDPEDHNEPDGVTLVCDDDDMAFDPEFDTLAIHRNDPVPQR